MYILVTYDVDTTSKEGARRLRCVAKACLDYGQRVQNSVFECVVTEAQYSLLKGRVRDIIDMSLDSGEFYQFNLSSCIRQQNSLTAQFVSFSLANLANIFYPPRFLQ